MLTHRHLQRMLLLFVLLLMVACGADNGDGDTDDTNLQGVIEDSTPTDIPATPTPTPLPEVDAETLLAGADYETLYVQDGTLYRLTSTSNQPEVVARNVHPASLNLAPDYSRLVFGFKFEGERGLMEIHSLGILDLMSMETARVELPERELHPVIEAQLENADFEVIGDPSYAPPVVHGWSADNQWAILSLSNTNDEIFVLNTFTGEYTELDWYSEEELPQELSTLWLADNTILVFTDRNLIDEETGLAGGVTVSDIYRFDPTSGERTPVTLSDEARRSLAFGSRLSPANLITLDNELRNQSLALATLQKPLDGTVFYDEMTAAVTIEAAEQPSGVEMPACNDWRVQLKPVRQASLPELLYSTEDATNLSDLTLLPDGALLLTRWRQTNCEVLHPEAITIDLLHVIDEETVRVIASDIAYDFSYPLIFGFYELAYQDWPSVARSPLYAVSPDGQYVAWVQDKDGQPAIMVSDLAAGRSATLLTTDEAASISSVVLFRAIR